MLKSRSDLIDGADTFSDVGRELGYFRDLIVKIEDRIIGGLDPNFLSILANTLEFGSDVFAAVQLFPEILVVGGLRVRRLNEKAMVPPRNFFEAITKNI